MLPMRRECRERFPRHRRQMKPLVSDPGMRAVLHEGIANPWWRGNVPGILGACTTRNFKGPMATENEKRQPVPWKELNHTSSNEPVLSLSNICCLHAFSNTPATGSATCIVTVKLHIEPETKWSTLCSRHKILNFSHICWCRCLQIFPK